MLNLKVVFPTIVGFLLACSAPALADITISDGDFNHWSFNSWGSAGPATAQVLATGGNLDANIEITTKSRIPAPGLSGATAIKDDFTTSGAGFEGGAFTFSFDVSNSASSFGNGHQIDLLVEQGGSIYGEHVGKTGVSSSRPDYYTLSFSGVMDASNFTLLLGPGAATPDFSGGTATRFGFGAWNTVSPPLTQNYDNYSLEIATSAVPESSSFVYMSMGLIGVWGVMRRRRKQA